MGFSKPDSLKGSISVKGGAITSAGVSCSTTGERTDAQKVKGLSHHSHAQATIRGQILSTLFYFVLHQ
jgi:hypothetical protein